MSPKNCRIKERIKELNCLYDISRFGASTDFSLDAILQAVIDFIPPAFQYPNHVEKLIKNSSRDITGNTNGISVLKYSQNHRLNNRPQVTQEVIGRGSAM
jgi:hypothetical protein